MKYFALIRMSLWYNGNIITRVHYAICTFRSFLRKDACKSDQFHQGFSNDYVVANFAFDTGENESSKFAKGC